MAPELEKVIEAAMARLPEMSPEEVRRWQAIIQILKAEYRKFEEGGVMPRSAIDAMAAATPDDLLRDVVKDLRSGPGEPGSWASKPDAPRQPVVRGTGWREPVVEDRTNQFKLMDGIVEHFAGGPNDTSKLR